MDFSQLPVYVYAPQDDFNRNIWRVLCAFDSPLLRMMAHVYTLNHGDKVCLVGHIETLLRTQYGGTIKLCVRAHMQKLLSGDLDVLNIHACVTSPWFDDHAYSNIYIEQIRASNPNASDCELQANAAIDYASYSEFRDELCKQARKQLILARRLIELTIDASHAYTSRNDIKYSYDTCTRYITPTIICCLKASNAFDLADAYEYLRSKPASNEQRDAMVSLLRQILQIETTFTA